MKGLQVNTCLTKLTISPRGGNEDNTFLILSSSNIERLDIIELALVFRLTTTLQFIELTVYMQSMELLPVLEALRENNSIKHLKLGPYVVECWATRQVVPNNLSYKIYEYTVTTEEAEAVGNVLAKNKTLEVFHINAGITECSPIVRGLLGNKTLKEFGTYENTKNNIVTCPEYVDIRRRIVFVENPHDDRFTQQLRALLF